MNGALGKVKWSGGVITLFSMRVPASIQMLLVDEDLCIRMYRLW